MAPRASHAEPRPNWANPCFSLRSINEMHAALADEALLDTFFERLHQIMTLIEAVPGTCLSNTDLARDMITRKRVNVLMYGRSGAGKTTLIGTLTGNSDLHRHGEAAVTKDVVNHATACGITFTDRPGIDIPGAQAQNAEAAATLAQMSSTS